MRTRGSTRPLVGSSMPALLCLAFVLAGTSGGVGRALATRALQAQPPPPNQNCTANATAGGYDCVVNGQMVHVNATANVTQVEAPGTIVWNNASNGDVTVTAPGVSVVCTTDAKGEQHCSVQTSWWSSSNATRTNNTATPTAPKPRLRGLAPARVEERDDGAVHVEAGGPAVDSTTDCRPLPNGAYNYSYDGTWAQVAADPGTNTTQVTAPGVSVHTNEGTGDVEVDAWGFHIVCKKDAVTGKVRCRTRNEWWPASSTTTEEEPTAPTTTTHPTVDEEEEAPRPSPHGHAPVPAQPVMHLPPKSATATANKASSILPATPTGEATARAPTPGYFPTEPVPLPAAAPVKTPTAGAKDVVVVVDLEGDKASGILPFTPTGEAATRPPTPGYFPEEPKPTLTPAEAQAAQQGGQGRMEDSVLVNPPSVVVTPLPKPPAAAASQQAALEEQQHVRVEPPMLGEPVIAVDPPITDAEMAPASALPPFPLLATVDTNAKQLEPEVVEQRPSKVKPSKPPTPPTEPAAPSDPLWQTNPKNCTRAVKGEGKGCFDEPWAPKPKPPVVKPGTNVAPPVAPKPTVAVAVNQQQSISDTVGDVVTNTAYAGTDGSRQKWGEEHDDPAPGPASTAVAPGGATAAASATPEPQGRRVLQRYQRWGEEKDDENGSGGRNGRRWLQQLQEAGGAGTTAAAGSVSSTVGDAVSQTIYAGTDGNRQRWGEEREDAAAAGPGAAADPQGRRRALQSGRWGEEKDDDAGSDGRGGRRGLQEQPERTPKHNHDDTYGGNDEPKGAPHDGNGSD